MPKEGYLSCSQLMPLCHRNARRNPLPITLYEFGTAINRTQTAMTVLIVSMPKVTIPIASVGML